MYPPNIGVDIDSCGEFQPEKHGQPVGDHPEIEAMIRLDEREACAKIAEKLEYIQWARTWKGLAPPIAKTIRDRGKTTSQ